MRRLARRGIFAGSVAAMQGGGPVPPPPVQALAFGPTGDHVNVDYANSTITNGDTTTPSANLRVKGVTVENENPGWWSPFIPLDGANGRRPTFTMPNTDMWIGDYDSRGRVLWSYDGRSWQGFDNNTITNTNYTFSNNAAFTQDRVYISLLPSIRVADRAFYFSEIAALRPTRFRALPGAANGAALMTPAGRVGVSGQAIPALPVLGAQVEDFASTLPKRTLVMLMGTHPGEDHAEREALAFLRAFATDDWLMARWRVLAYYINPAGQYGGSRRTTFEGTEPGGNAALIDDNSNRLWTSNPSPLADIQAVKDRIVADVAALGLSQVDAFNDFHGAPYADRVYTYGGPGSLSPLEAAYVSIWQGLRGGITVDLSVNATASLGWAKSTISTKFGLSTEVGSNWGALSQSDYDIFGVEMVDAFKRATAQMLFPVAQSSGVFRSMAGGTFDLQTTPVASAPRNAWSI